MSERPGIMFYFSDWSGILNLGDDATLGRFARAALEYGLSGTDTTFEGIGRAIWEPLKARIDRDGKRYVEKCNQNRYNRYCGTEKAAGRTPLDRDEWDGRQRALTAVIECDQLHTHTQS